MTDTTQTTAHPNLRAIGSLLIAYFINTDDTHLKMAVNRIQDRTFEFQSVVQQAARKQAQAKGGAGTAQKKRSMMLGGVGNDSSQRQQLNVQQQQPLLSADSGYAHSDTDHSGAVAGRPVSSRSEFARRAAEIGRGIASTMAKLERLALCMSPAFL